MQHYANASGTSGVVGYALGDGWIDVWFASDPQPYRYDRVTPGARHVAAMQQRARAGRGLATYINRHVRGRYAGRPAG